MNRKFLITSKISSLLTLSLVLMTLNTFSGLSSGCGGTNSGGELGGPQGGLAGSGGGAIGSGGGIGGTGGSPDGSGGITATGGTSGLAGSGGSTSGSGGSSAGSGGSASPAISVGSYHTCTLLPDYSVRCWGDNTYGQLGVPSTTANSSTPVSVTGLSGVSSIAAGESHMCALLTDHSVRCWGDNSHEQLGIATTTATSSTPVSVTGLSGVSSIAAESYHTCALLIGGTVQCWGDNTYGELGVDPTITLSSFTPVSVTALSGVLSITSGSSHTCALLTDHSVKCWGDNTYGELGVDPTITPSSFTPVSVPSLSGVLGISAGYQHTCALLTGGTVQCWGYNTNGELGVDPLATSSSFTPVSVPSLSDVIQINSTSSDTCTLASNRTVKCWGYNGDGELGDGGPIIPRSNRFTPSLVAGLSDVAAVSVGNYQVCALLTNGSIRCWGDNASGQLGNGTTTSSSTPVTVSGF